MAAPGNCVFVSGTAVGATTILLPGRIWTELECAQAVVQAQKSANGAIHEANDGECTAVLDMQSVAADPAGLQRSCFIYSAATPTNQICTVAPSACDAAEHGTPFEGADLTLPGRALGGSIPTQIGVLAQLIALDLSDNMLSGSVPSQLGLLTQLETLDVGYNRLSGSIPSELGRLSRLITLDVADNRLGGSLPTQLGLLHPAFCYLLRRQRTQPTRAGNESGGDSPSSNGDASGAVRPGADDNRFDCPLPTLYPGCGQNGLSFEGRVASGQDACGGSSGLVSYTLASVQDVP